MGLPGKGIPPVWRGCCLNIPQEMACAVPEARGPGSGGPPRRAGRSVRGRDRRPGPGDAEPRGDRRGRAHPRDFGCVRRWVRMIGIAPGVPGLPDVWGGCQRSPSRWCAGRVRWKRVDSWSSEWRSAGRRRSRSEGGRPSEPDMCPRAETCASRSPEAAACRSGRPRARAHVLARGSTRLDQAAVGGWEGSPGRPHVDAGEQDGAGSVQGRTESGTIVRRKRIPSAPGEAASIRSGRAVPGPRSGGPCAPPPFSGVRRQGSTVAAERRGTGVPATATLWGYRDGTSA